jgi:hypothetical protein
MGGRVSFNQFGSPEAIALTGSATEHRFMLRPKNWPRQGPAMAKFKNHTADIKLYSSLC